MSEPNLFFELDAMLGQVLAQLSPASRRRLTRTLAAGLRKRQSSRIGKQQAPDGTDYPTRKKRANATQGGIRFLWHNGGSTEIRELKNWRTTRAAGDGRKITGFDVDKGAVRSFRKEDIEHYLSIDVRRTEKRSKKADAMFRKLRTSRYLLARSNDNEATVGFTGQAGAIARIHQFGLRDNIHGQHGAKYPLRALLGLNDDDVQWISDTIDSHLKA
ncbi:phage virion morphogenesis protein [Enterobacteriaceae bacterium ML5]|nr:phage virion morphogenesis protein [Enterobacteriaceae bacterium ML5]